jgi:DNA mismatch endonuclease (patch repair protein)
VKKTKAQISYNMSRIRSSGTAIETDLGRALWSQGFRYRKQYPIIGKPDFVLVRYKIAIFCDNEFWHGYRWGMYAKSKIKSNQVYWFQKIERNRKRDRLVNKKLRADGWTVFRFWGREIKNDPSFCVSKIAQHLFNQGI